MIIRVLVIVLCVHQYSALNISKICGPEPILEQDSDLNIGFLINDCDINETVLTRTLTSHAKWTVERLNSLEYTDPVKLGLTVYKTCKDSEYFDAIFQLYRANDEGRLLGIIANKYSGELLNFCDVLGVDKRIIPKNYDYLMKATVKLLSALEWKENITVISTSREILREFYRFSRREWMCVKEEILLTGPTLFNSKRMYGPTVVFGDYENIKRYLSNLFYTPEEEVQIIFIPLDGSQINGLPESSYVILPPHRQQSTPHSIHDNIIPSPLLFEVAGPIINYAQNISRLISESCQGNDTFVSQNSTCLTKSFSKYTSHEVLYDPTKIMDILKIGPLKNKFIYNIFRIENLSLTDTPAVTLQSFVKVYTYSIFDDVLSNLETNVSLNGSNYTIPGSFCPKSNDECISECVNFEVNASKTASVFHPNIWLRADSWIFGCLAVALLGVFFCFAVFIFLMIRICKRDILEGNPTLTLLLLVVTTFTYLSVFPLAITGDETTNESICLARTLSMTLCYTGAFSLLLGRIILLSSSSKEIGFMSHVAGPVQSFLTLFIFAVQCALDIQLIGNCEALYNSYNFLYLLSYNVVLLVLLISLCPLVVRSQRNYREGKYFVMSICLMTCAWSFWLPTYVLIGANWKDMVLSIGLILTASILTATIFIPRTYLMAMAEARDQLTTVFPSLVTATSSLDICRGNAQAIYDCVNIAAINNNSSAVVRNSQQSQDLYIAPVIQEDDDLAFERSETPVSDDKMTRF